MFSLFHKKIFLIIAPVLFLLFFGLATKSALAAGEIVENPQGILQIIEERGLVPCGNSVNNFSCELCDIFALAQNVTSFIMAFAMIVSGAFVAYGGFMIILGSYSEQKVTEGKKILTSAVVGLLITLFAWMIVDTSIKVLRGLDAFELPSGNAVGLGTFGPWNAINCQINQ